MSVFQLDTDRLLHYLSTKLDRSYTDLAVTQFKGGQSNPTYLLTLSLSTGQVWKCVLRKQPPGTIQNSAHNVLREAAIMRALRPQGVPVPEVYLTETDASVVGSPFFVMEFLDGVVHRSAALPDLSPADRTKIYQALVSVLAKLHAVDVRRLGETLAPSSSSSSYTKGYCARQVKLWTAQHARSCELSGTQFPSVDTLAQWLQRSVPPGDAQGRYGYGSGARLVHGDFRMDNVVFAATDSSLVLGVLDWELAAIGDPSADLAYLCLPFHLPPQGALRVFSLLRQQPIEGVPTETEIRGNYARLIAAPACAETDWTFYLSLGLFRMSCIASGIYSRSVLGNAVGGALASQMLEMVPLLSGVALELIAAIDAAPGAVEQMGFPLCETGRRMLRRLRKFNQDFAIPAEKEVLTHYHVSEGVWPSRGNRWRRHRMIDELIAEARKLGLWNLWVSPVLARQLTTEFPAWPWDRLLPHGQALSAVSYAYIAMESGRCSLTPVLINCAAPDSGNMEVIGMFGTRQQKERWLLPLLEGETKSCFGMTEPAISSSDPTALSATAVPITGGGWRLNGDKWWTTGACHETCSVCVFVARTSSTSTLSSADPVHRRHSLFLVPMDAEGVTVVKPLHVFGYDDAPGGHAEVHFCDVLVDVSSLLGGLGEGFPHIQSRLGPGRLHHCARLLGHGERAIEEILRRGSARAAFGKSLLSLGGNMEKLADCRVRVNGARLLVLNAAAHLDSFHTSQQLSTSHKMHEQAMVALAVAKLETPRSMQACLDFAVQIHGGGGLSFDHPLAVMWTACRVLRLVDGADEVHQRTIAKIEYKGNSIPAIGRAKL